MESQLKVLAREQAEELAGSHHENDCFSKALFQYGVEKWGFVCDCERSYRVDKIAVALEALYEKKIAAATILLKSTSPQTPSGVD